MVLKEKETFLKVLENRFQTNMHRHQEIKWKKVLKEIEENEEVLSTLIQMEETGGEPDVIVFENNETLAFVDCSKESPKGRRNVCYDDEALQSRKKFKPENSAIKMAEEMGLQILTEEEYRLLQRLEAVDLKTSSWLETPQSIRHLGGAIFGDRRYDHVFIYHNGAESYYNARGFRGIVYLN